MTSSIAMREQGVGQAAPLNHKDKTEMQDWKGLAHMLCNKAQDRDKVVRQGAVNALSCLVVHALQSSSPPETIAALLAPLDPKKRVALLSDAQQQASSLVASHDILAPFKAHATEGDSEEGGDENGYISVPHSHKPSQCAPLTAASPVATSAAKRPISQSKTTSGGSVTGGSRSGGSLTKSTSPPTSLAPGQNAKRAPKAPQMTGKALKAPPLTPAHHTGTPSSSKAEVLSVEEQEQQGAQLLRAVALAHGSGVDIAQQLQDNSWKVRHEALELLTLALTIRQQHGGEEGGLPESGWGAVGLLRLLCVQFVKSPKVETNLQVCTSTSPPLLPCSLLSSPAFPSLLLCLFSSVSCLVSRWCCLLRRVTACVLLLAYCCLRIALVLLSVPLLLSCVVWSCQWGGRF